MNECSLSYQMADEVKCLRMLIDFFLIFSSIRRYSKTSSIILFVSQRKKKESELCVLHNRMTKLPPLKKRISDVQETDEDSGFNLGARGIGEEEAEYDLGA